MVGLALEAYGFWLLFCEFIPTVLSYSRRLPFVGRMLEVPWLRAVSGRSGVQKVVGDWLVSLVDGGGCVDGRTVDCSKWRLDPCTHLFTPAHPTAPHPTAVQQGNSGGRPPQNDGRCAQ